MVLSFPSAAEMEEQYSSGDREYKNLPEDFYILQIKSVEIQKDKTNQWQPTPHDEWKVGFEVVSFQNGEPVFYADGSEPEADRTPYLTAFINPTKMGMVPQPSKARRFLTAALGLDVGARVELDSVESLVGKRLVGRVIHKPDSKNAQIQRDRLDDFLAIRRRPTRTAAPAKTEDVEADAVDLLATAKEIFGSEIQV